jgi:hypothetical protein
VMVDDEIYRIAREIGCKVDSIARVGGSIHLTYNETFVVQVKVNTGKRVARDRVSQAMRLIRMRQGV